MCFSKDFWGSVEERDPGVSFPEKKTGSIDNLIKLNSIS